jgi:cyclohexyl-isocyanide hydratase
MMKRRSFIKASAASMLAGASGAKAHDHDGTATKESADQHHQQAMEKYAGLTGGEKVTIAMLVYPGMYLLDLVGPLAVFEALMHRDIHLVWKDTQPVRNEKPEHPTFIPVPPSITFKDCPQQLDVLFVPGGVPGTLTMMEDPEVLAFLADRGKTARFVTSVCTGSLILGAAGLLRGYQATSHWATLDVLSELGATPTRERIAVDRNRITGGGVTAGIDLGLQIVALLRSEDYAKAVQLYLEYAPAPPFDAGTPEAAPPIVNEFLTEMFAGMKDAATATAKRARARFG